MAEKLKPLLFVASAEDDISAMPTPVKRALGFALYEAQAGRKHPGAKPLKGFKGTGVLEVVEDHDGDTYRAVYTVEFKSAVYVLHVFQKKSKTGIKTPKADIAVINTRLKRVRELEKEAIK